MGAETTRRGGLAWTAGLVGLLVAGGASAVLSADHLQLLGEHLPGCGPESGCSRLTRGPWGRLPGLGWPTAHVGLALFTGLLVAWLVGRQRSVAALRPVALAGIVATLVLLGVMFTEAAFCPWCLTVHAGNLLFVAATLLGSWPPREGRGPLLAGGLVAVLAIGCLAVVTGMREATLEARRQDRLAESTAAILAQAGREDAAAAFGGRWVTGADEAPIRVVLFADYQCDGCNAVEREAAGLLAGRDDMSLSVKHVPMGRDCHPDLSEDIHPNACESARAAEAAGALGGNDGFWRLHHWLVESQGDFTRAELVDALPGLGFDPDAFQASMASDVVARHIQDDIAEGKTLGLLHVPMVFVNGLELKEVETAGALTGVVEALAAELERGVEPTFVAPATALDKALTDFLAVPVVSLPPDPGGFSRGAATPAVDIVVFGDYGQAYTRDLDVLLDRFVSTSGDLRTTFRHFPLDPTCNDLPALRERPAGTCRLASLAEAAGRVAGADAFWRAHRWLFEHQGTSNDKTLRAAAGELQLDAGAWFAEAGSAAVAQAIAGDIAAWHELSLKGVPIVFVNGRQVPRWRIVDQPDAPVLERILQLAREGR